jgi:hypothetical protein
MLGKVEQLSTAAGEREVTSRIAGQDSDGTAGRLRIRIRELGLEDNVRMVARFVPTPQVSEHLYASDLVVLPYEHVTNSGVLASAALCGRAVVASRVGGMSEAVALTQAGLLVPPRRPIPLAAALNRMLEDTPLREETEKLTLEGARLHYRWDAIGRRLDQLYREVTRPVKRLLLVSPVVFIPARCGAAAHTAALLAEVEAAGWEVTYVLVDLFRFRVGGRLQTQASLLDEAAET